jgi:hypothetical protein
VVAIPSYAYAAIFQAKEADGSGSWANVASLTEASSGSKLGISAAMYGDTVALGAPSDVFGTPAGVVSSGSVHIYVQSSAESWDTPDHLRLYDPDAGDLEDFGRAVALHDNTLVVSNPEVPAVYVYDRPLGDPLAFERTAELFPSVGGDTSFGKAVAFDGHTLVVGAPHSGAVYVFERAGDAWQEVKRFTGTPGENYNYAEISRNAGFGTSVSVSDDILVIGSLRDETPMGQGAAHVMWRGKDGWEPLTVIEGDVMDADTGAVVAVRGPTLMVSSMVYAANSPHGSVTREYFIKK